MNEDNEDKVFNPNQTSAKFLMQVARFRANESDEDNGNHWKDRSILAYDLYIKARSYAILNKICFLLASIAGLMVLIWPSMAIITAEFGIEGEFLKSAVIQTTITGIAALTFAIFSHYKKRQTQVENLMRHCVFSADEPSVLADGIVSEINRLDLGFNFSKGVFSTTPPEDHGSIVGEDESRSATKAAD